MSNDTASESGYTGPETGKYPVEDHLRAQNEQTYPGTDRPLQEVNEAPASAPDPIDTAESDQGRVGVPGGDLGDVEHNQPENQSGQS